MNNHQRDKQRTNTEIAVRLKDKIVFLGVNELIPQSLADFLIQKLGLKHV